MTPADELERALRDAVEIQKIRPGSELELAASLRALPAEQLANQILQVLEAEARGPDADTSACDWLAKTLIEVCGISWLEPLLALRVPYRAFDQELADTIVPAQWTLARPIIARALGSDCIALAKVIFGLLSKPLQAELFPALMEISLTHPARDLVYLATVLRESAHPLSSQFLARLRDHEEITVRLAAVRSGSAGAAEAIAATIDSSSPNADLTSLLAQTQRFAEEPVVHAALLRLLTRCDESQASSQREAAIAQ